MKLKNVFYIFLFFLISPALSFAATLSITPSTGSFSIGSTFDVSIYLDTKGKPVNAVSVSLSFPPDLLQVVSPSTGQSIIGVWTAAPRFDNSTGKIELQGGIPGGITASNALVSTITFRVRSVGEGIVKFLDSSKVLLNDGLGTNALNQTGNAVFEFKLPAPLGPAVVSDTNPDEGSWYRTPKVSFKFLSDAKGVTGYSYILTEDPTTIPDNISQGMKNFVEYSNLSDGIHYFHIRSLRDGSWGGTTHFAVKIDTTAPSDFKINVIPSSKTTSKQPILEFSTTDNLSGVDHYELKIIPLSIKDKENISGSSFFIEVTSPYVSPVLDYGDYDAIVRVYDKAGNIREVVQRIVISAPIFSFVTKDGFEIFDTLITWPWVISFFVIIILWLIYLLFKIKKWRDRVSKDHENKMLPKEVIEKLEELKKLKARYGKALLIVLVLFAFSGQYVKADFEKISPPLITGISKNISDKDIFYVSGRSEFTGEKITLYFQNLSTGETFSKDIYSDEKADWFYKHDNSVAAGEYLVWAQASIGGESSPTGPNYKMSVKRTALQFNGSTLSYESIYIIIIIILFAITIILILYSLYHFYHGKKKHILLTKEVDEAENAVIKGFTEIRKDLEKELDTIKKAKNSNTLSEAKADLEEKILKDIELIKKHIDKEVGDIRKEI